MTAQYHLYLEMNWEALSLDININTLRVDDKWWARNIKIPLKAVKVISRLTDTKVITSKVYWDNFEDLDHYL